MVDSAADIRNAFSQSRLIGQLPEPLRAYALARCLEAAPYLERIPGVFGEYTDHGVSHSCAVLRLADKLVAQNQLSEWEILIFVLSAFHHDIGMSCPSDALDSFEEDQFRREHRYLRELVLPMARLIDDTPETVEKQVRIEYIRRHHGERGARWIARELPATRPEAMIEKVFVWDLVIRVCIGHTLESHELKGDAYPRAEPIGTLKSVDVRFLTCLLRLADICHLSRDRALPHVRESMKFTSRQSEEIWKAAGDIPGVDFDERRAVILVSAQSQSFERHRLISKFVEEIGTELQNAHRLLSDQGGWGYQFPWRFVDDSKVQAHPLAPYIYEPDARFHLVHDKIIHLLMGSKLYAEPLYALRECLQNSVDAIRLLRLKDRSSVGRIIVQHRFEPEGSAILEVFDNGTGMDREICLRHLLSVGSSPFAATERRYKDWGPGDIQQIAQHGIGFLSCFMLADRVDVFSKYPEAERVHLVLDSPTWIGELRKTGESEFPQWDSNVLPESTPWEERHGTCVRLYLKAELTKLRLMAFLAENILRLGERVGVIYGDETVELAEVWSTPERGYDQVPGDASLTELKEKLFSGQGSRDFRFFHREPGDPGLKPVEEMAGEIRGTVRLKHEGYEEPRLSQDGILVREGAASLLAPEAGSRGWLDFPYYFDLDVRGSKRFELDAERARLVDPEGALTSELLWWIEEKGLRAIGAIGSPLYFPCGGSYYHGGADLLAEHSNPVIMFHEVLHQWYTPERLKLVLDREKFDAFVQAKIFAAIGEAHNEPLSIADMRREQHFVLVPRAKLLCGEIDSDLSYSESREDRLREQLGSLVIQGVGKAVDLDKVVFLPKFPKSFTLPISTVFDFEWIEASPIVLLGRLIEREKWKVPEEDSIANKFRAAGGFLPSKTVIEALAAGGRRHRARPQAG
jgi:hypothetical protein